MKNSFLLILLLPLFTFAQPKPKTPAKAKPTAHKPLDSYIINGNIAGLADGTVVDLMTNQGGQEAETTIKDG